MRATITERFNFKMGQIYTQESLHPIGEFIAKHLGIDTVKDAHPERGVLKSDTKVIITIGYERQDTEVRGS